MSNFSAHVRSAVLAHGYYHAEFTSADIRRMLEGQGVFAAHSNQWGAMFRTLQANGWIQSVASDYSPLPQRHHSRVVVWELSDFAYTYVHAMAGMYANRG